MAPSAPWCGDTYPLLLISLMLRSILKFFVLFGAVIGSYSLRAFTRDRHTQRLFAFVHTETKDSEARLKSADRRLWVFLSRFWSRWRSALVLVKPNTVIDWRRRGSDGTGLGSCDTDKPDDLESRKKHEN